MTKKITAIFLIFLLVFNLSIIANAENKDNGVTYGMDESFVMTIPAVIKFDSRTEALTIYVSENYLNEGNELNLSFRSYFGSSTPGELVNISDSSKKIRYNIRKGSFIFGPNASMLVAEAGMPESSANVDIYLVDEKIPAGSYYDILTFIVEISLGK